MTTTRRLMASLVGAMCASAPPTEGFTPPGCLVRVCGSGDAFYSTERRLAAAAAAAEGRTCNRVWGATRKRRKTWTYARPSPMPMSAAPALAVERQGGVGGKEATETPSLEERGIVTNEISFKRSTRSSSTSSNPLKYFLQDIGKVPLLTPEEEVILGRQVQKGAKLMGMRAHLELIRGRDPTNEEWAYALGVDVKQLEKELSRSSRAKKAMISANLRLVVNIAKRYRYTPMPLMDLIQEGTFGLVRAVERYDPERGFRFSTYAVWWIKQRIGQGATEKSRTVRLPQHVHSFVSQLRRATLQLTDIDGNPPTDYQLSTHMDASLYKIQFYRRAARDILSMEKPRGANSRSSSSSSTEVNLGEIIPTKMVTPERSSLGLIMKSKVSELLMTLSSREQEVMRARFGLDGMKQRSLEEVGRDFEISRERVRQIEARAMHKLRQPYRNYRVRDFAHSSLQGRSTQAVKTDAASIAAAAATIAAAEAADQGVKAAYRRAQMGLPPLEDEAKAEELGVRSEMQSRADMAGSNWKPPSTGNPEFRPSEVELEASTEWGVNEADFEAYDQWLEGADLAEDNLLLSTLDKFEYDSGAQQGETEKRPQAPGSDSGLKSESGSRSKPRSGPKVRAGAKARSTSESESESRPSDASETLARLRSEMESHPMSLGGRANSDVNSSSLQLV